MVLSGSYEDAVGLTPVVWTIGPFERSGWEGRFEVNATIRGVQVSGAGFNSLEPEEPADDLSLNQAGELDHCTLTVDVPARITGAVSTGTIATIVLRLGAGMDEPVTRVTLTVDGIEYEHEQEEVFEVVLGAVVAQMQPRTWQCCLTCLLSDYSPGGQDFMGMRCHRGAREAYLAARTKWEYWAVPVTEEVPEFYRCPSYETRVPGTGYRG